MADGSYGWAILKIAMIIEGETEKAFLPHLRQFLKAHLSPNMPNIDPFPYDGRIPKGDKLRRIVENLLRGKKAVDHVIALTDVYTGTIPHDFVNAEDAKKKLIEWVGHEARFHPHVAQYEFEAWLLPYWSTIRRLAGHNRAAPPGRPETIDHDNPPGNRIKEIFQAGTCRDSYIKPRDANRILRENDLNVAISQCVELKALVNTIISVSGGNIIL